MSAPDTSTQRIKEMAAWHAREAAAWNESSDVLNMAQAHKDTAATLRALAAERDGLLAKAFAAGVAAGNERIRCNAMQAERDAARAEVAALREALQDMLSVTFNPSPGSLLSQARQKARAALAGGPPA